jgi:tetratricopeptide (TPR) repeat protein
MLTESDLAASIDLHVELMAMARRVGRLDGLLSLTSNFGYSAFLAGRWDAAMEAMEPVLAGEMSDRERLVMLNNATIVRVNRGEVVDDDLVLLRELAHKMQGAQPEMFLADPEANSALSNGELQTASARFLVIADDDPSQMPEYAYRAARPMLWTGDIDAARACYDKVAERGAFSPVATARIATLEAGIAALEGRTSEATALYREALRGWRDAHSRWDEVLTGIDMALLLDPTDPEVAEGVKSTRAILEELRARTYLERLDAAALRAAAEPAPSRGSSVEAALAG